jgi:hypothetical protein
MPVIEAQCASILVPHDHRHINQLRTFTSSAVMYRYTAVARRSRDWRAGRRHEGRLITAGRPADRRADLGSLTVGLRQSELEVLRGRVT